MFKVEFIDSENKKMYANVSELKEALAPIFEENVFDPLYLIFTESGLKFHFSKNLFYAYWKGEISFHELSEESNIKDLWRNKVPIVNIKVGEIDSGSLWKQIHDDLILVDEDRYLTATINLTFFEKIT